jgi:putative membrane protein
MRSFPLEAILQLPSMEHSMKAMVTLLSLSALVGCSMLDREGAPSAAGGASAASSSDESFMRDISQANLAEIATGNLAVRKAQSPAVKQFGQHMISEHSTLETQGGALAQAKGVKPPTAPDLRHQAAMAKLEAVSGDAFDRDYMQQMVKDHTETLRLLQDTAAKAQDPQLRNLAQQAIPHVQQHLEMAQRLTGEVVGSAR